MPQPTKGNLVRTACGVKVDKHVNFRETFPQRLGKTVYSQVFGNLDP